MDDDPAQRLTTSEAKRVLRGESPAPASPVRSLPGRDSAGLRLSDEQWEQAVDGIVSHLLASMDPSAGERLWPASCAHGSPDPRTVQLGAAGVLGVLTRCSELTGDDRLPDAVATIAGWIGARLHEGEKRAPGLHFGEAGIAWALHDAGRALGDDRLVRQALALAEVMPVSEPNPDVTHGTAGIGMAALHLWSRSGKPELLDRACQSADALVATASEESGGLIWGTPAAFESRLAGGKYYGFAHGTAGVGYFLLAAGLATGRSDYLTLAHRAGETLLTTATVAEGVALWGAGPGDPMTAPYWCHGSSGIGTFLARLYATSGDDRFAKLAEMAAQAVMENSWRGVLGQCHGLAGNGEFLLDMAGVVDRPRYEALAQQHARVAFASRAYRDGRVVFPDEQGGPSASWADGMSGVLAFLLRLRYGSPRLWMVDSLLEPGGRS